MGLHRGSICGALAVAAVALLLLGTSVSAAAAPTFSVDLAGSETVMRIRESGIGNDLRLWASLITNLPQDAIALKVAASPSGGVRLTFSAAARGTTQASLAAVLRPKVAAQPQKTLGLLTQTMRNIKLDVAVVGVVVPPQTYPVAFLPPTIDLAGTKFINATAARVLITWAGTNRPVANATFTLTPAGPAGGAALLPSAVAVSGTAVGATFPGVEFTSRYTVAVSVTDRSGAVSTLAQPFILGAKPLPAAKSTADLATAVRFTTVIDGLTLAQHDAELLAQYKAGIAGTAQNTSISVVVQSRAHPGPTYGNVILDTLVTFPPGPTTDRDAYTLYSLLGRRNYFVYGSAVPNKYGDKFGDVAHLESLEPPYKVLPNGNDPPAGLPFLQPALLLTVAVHELDKHTTTMVPKATAAMQKAMNKLTKVPSLVQGTLFTDLLTAASPELTPCVSTQITSADVDALKAFAKLATTNPAAIFPKAELGDADIREFSAQIRMVAKAALPVRA